MYSTHNVDHFYINKCSHSQGCCLSFLFFIPMHQSSVCMRITLFHWWFAKEWTPCEDSTSDFHTPCQLDIQFFDPVQFFNHFSFIDLKRSPYYKLLIDILTMNYHDADNFLCLVHKLVYSHIIAKTFNRYFVNKCWYYTSKQCISTWYCWC